MTAFALAIEWNLRRAATPLRVDLATGLWSVGTSKRLTLARHTHVTAS